MKRAPYKQNQKSTSWEPANKWYKQIVGDEGHYYHQKIIIPALMRILNLKEQGQAALLDLACGTGVLARHLPKNTPYVGVDISPSFIKEAKNLDKELLHTYHTADATQKLPIKDQTFTHGTIVLALQNIEHPLKVFQNFAKFLNNNGLLVIVLNHPYFRIPRQTSWEVDKERKIQYRRVDRYFSPLEIPIQAHPSKGQKSEQLLSYHFPLSSYINWLNEAGFALVNMEEWCSDKVSEGGAAKMENRSRAEIPLFMCLVARLTK
jgi:ubiquinone/menaquinone biosynthesis C-methylase UbiE